MWYVVVPISEQEVRVSNSDLALIALVVKDAAQQYNLVVLHCLVSTIEITNKGKW